MPIPGGNPVAQWLYTRALRDVSALMFPSASSAAVWQVVVGANTDIYLLPEVSSPFTGVPRQQARRDLGTRKA